MSSVAETLDNLVPLIKEYSFTSISLLTIGITLLRIVLISYILAPFGRWALPKENKKVLPKLLESLWFFIYYTTTSVIGGYLLYTADWANDTKNYWGDTFTAPPIKSFLYLFLYLLELSNYISALIFILFLDHERKNHKDKLIMTIHHVVTIILVSVSYVTLQHRIGLVVLFIHDTSDIILEGSKTLKYLKFDRIVNFGFAAFATSFFFKRLVAFPTFVLYPIINHYTWDAYYEIRQSSSDKSLETEALLSINTKIFWLALLGTLQILHIYWFCLIARMIIYAMREKHVKSDIRSDDEDETINELSNDTDHTKLRGTVKKQNGRM